MIIDKKHADFPVGPIWASQCRAARALLNWRQEDLAEAAGLSLPLVRKYETDKGPHTVGATAALRAAFEAAGIRFAIDGNPPTEYGVKKII